MTFRLDQSAREFADTAQTLLNKTVCEGITLQAVRSHTQADRFMIGYGITKTVQTPEYGIPLTIDDSEPPLYLGLSYRLGADDESHFLMVESSFVGLSIDREQTRTLLHFDYERNKPHGYPEAHIQIEALGKDWAEVLSGRPLAPDAVDKLHIPVGGRRFRPSLEDVVEFLCTERLTKCKDGWGEAVQTRRDAYLEQQLRAAVRRNPAAAIEELRRGRRIPGEWKTDRDGRPIE